MLSTKQSRDKSNDRGKILELKPLSGFLANCFATRKGLNPAVQEDVLEALTEASQDLFNAVGSNLLNDLKPTDKRQLGLQGFSNMPDSTLLDQPQAAAFLDLSEHALQIWRTTGRYGLPYIKLGRKIRYRLGDLRQFLASRTRTHTGQGK